MPGSWTITIDRWEGMAPGFFINSLSAIGNKGHASAMEDIDIIDQNVLTQGPGLATLTNGSEGGAVTTLIKGMLRVSPDGTNIYGVGGNKLLQITSSLVTNSGNFPHTIDKAAVTSEDGEDVAYYNSKTFYSYNHSGTAGDVGTWDGSSFDDDYMSTVPTGAAALVGGVPHQMQVGGDNTLTITNGRYLARLSATTFTSQVLDFPANDVSASLAWNHNRWYVATNNPSTTSSIQAESSIYIWDGVSTSWEYQIKVMGKIGAVYAKNGIVYCWYQDPSYIGGYKLGIVSGTEIVDVAFYTGSLPAYYQVTEDKNHVAWVSDGKVWYWGAIDAKLSTALFQRADAGYATGGGISNAFATPIVASYDGVSAYKVAKFSGYSLNASYKTILFDVSNGEEKSQIDRISVFTEPMSTGARMDTTLTFDYAKSSQALQAVQYSGENKTRHTIWQDGFDVENFRLDFSFANGSTENPVKVRKVIVNGHYVADK